ncbi:hypothetical protein thalar_01530 [Litoreibacter arenae DSM 19593]|uniref:Uncharacterized protein n=2 Tax=Litoreibacter TaxID=947567 RepID=S9QFI3_9RHOB|nr:hypothetical protein thalar_01530 [Litoreibacter arenae DSM 19593]
MNMAHTALKSLVNRLAAWLNSSLSFSKEETIALAQHRDMWSSKRSQHLKRKVSYYAY